jgi:hypothetical protein
MDETQLKARSGVEHVGKVLKRLQTKYDGILKPAIRMAGRKGKGGYHVSIRRQ